MSSDTPRRSRRSLAAAALALALLPCLASGGPAPAEDPPAGAADASLLSFVPAKKRTEAETKLKTVRSARALLAASRAASRSAWLDALDRAVMAARDGEPSAASSIIASALLPDAAAEEQGRKQASVSAEAMAGVIQAAAADPRFAAAAPGLFDRYLAAMALPAELEGLLPDFASLKPAGRTAALAAAASLDARTLLDALAALEPDGRLARILARQEAFADSAPAVTALWGAPLDAAAGGAGSGISGGVPRPSPAELAALALDSLSEAPYAAELQSILGGGPEALTLLLSFLSSLNLDERAELEAGSALSPGTVASILDAGFQPAVPEEQAVPPTATPGGATAAGSPGPDADFSDADLRYMEWRSLVVAGDPAAATALAALADHPAAGDVFAPGGIGFSRKDEFAAALASRWQDLALAMAAESRAEAAAWASRTAGGSPASWEITAIARPASATPFRCLVSAQAVGGGRTLAIPYEVAARAMRASLARVFGGPVGAAGCRYAARGDDGAWSYFDPSPRERPPEGVQDEPFADLAAAHPESGSVPSALLRVDDPDASPWFRQAAIRASACGALLASSRLSLADAARGRP